MLKYFECFASTGVNTPETMLPSTGELAGSLRPTPLEMPRGPRAEIPERSGGIDSKPPNHGIGVLADSPFSLNLLLYGSIENFGIDWRFEPTIVQQGKHLNIWEPAGPCTAM
jgi:hypothetical protein